MTVNTDPLCPQQHTHPKHSPNRCIFCEYGAAVRADALNAAREAVAALPLTGGWTTPDGVIEEIDKAKTVAAIDALRKEN